ncbi:MAG: hypothetical protein HY529_04080, partial [Chloroflexi bacterium]|nr:hypothetical protein [Chloroflexota bacterium]
MKRKVISFLLSSLVVLSLVLSSCAPAAPTTPTTPATPKAPTAPATPTAPTTPAAPTAPAPIAEKPKYGGVFTFAVPIEQIVFDDAYRGRVNANTYAQTNMSIMTGDWAKGPAGTGEADFYDWTTPTIVQTGEIAESWETPDEETIIYHIRKGIRWAIDPDNAMSRLVNG